MSSMSHSGNRHFGAAGHLVMAMLFALRCSAAWAAADLRSHAPFETSRAASRVAALAAVKLAPVRCEAARDDPPPPSDDRMTLLRWGIPAAPVAALPFGLCTSVPAPLPPARGPPGRARFTIAA